MFHKLKVIWCELTHGGGRVKRDPQGRISWQCSTCDRWSDHPVEPEIERYVIDRDINKYRCGRCDGTGEEPEALPTATTPLNPTKEMIDAGAQRLVRFEGDAQWPDDFDKLEVAAARNEAERVWRSMWLATPQ